MKIALRFALIYIAVASTYILLSDWLILSLTRDPEALTRWQHLKGLAFIGTSGLLIFTFVYYYVRSRDRAQRQLEDASNSFQQLFQRSPNPTVVYDTQTLRFLAVNEATVTEYGYALDEFPKLTVTDLCRPEDLEKALTHIARVSRPYTGHWEHRRKDGSIFEVELVSHPMVFEGKPARLVTVRNITTRKLIEKVLTEAQLARNEGSEMKSRFLSTISHEMRTPLNGISGCLELLESETDPARRNDLSDTAQKSASELLTLIERLIQAAEINNTPARTEIREIELEPFLERITKNFATSAERKNIKLIITVGESLPKSAHLHAEWLEQTLQILIENSIKFSSGGTVQLSVEENAQEGLQFALSDEGIGIAEAEQLKIFDSFYQADQSFSRKYGGLGLGLFVARQLCELMDATLAVHSSPESGSTFVISLPPEKKQA